MITKYFENIPSEWQLVELQEVLHSFQNGYAFSATDYQEEGIPIVSMASIGLDGNFTLNEKSAKKWTNSDLQKLSQYILQNGDLIIAMTDVTPEKNLIGRMTIVDKHGPFFLNQRVGLLKVDRSKVDAYFLKAFSNFKWWRDYSRATATAGVQANLSTIDIKKAPIPLPPLEVQQEIAQILSTWDEAIEAVEELIEKKKRLREKLLATLLTGMNRMKGFENSRWINVTMNDVGTIFSGGTPSTDISDYWDGGIAWCTPTDITALKGKRLINKTSRTITEKGLKASSANYLPKNSIVVCTRATIGYVAMNDIPMATNQGFKSIVPNEKVDSIFLYYLTLTLKKYFIRFSSGSTFLELSKKDFAKAKFIIPENISEQRSIAEIMVSLDESIEQLSAKHNLLKKQKNGLMQKLLTGQTKIT